eukprot:CAMPEP_0180363202 /NCGR_PEP_ID=MMETSP0989-20121125/13860_1 /TAXON_ID=697907 /ORGANISM="non described non described, Strain CCMP2293" /LENGTH=97 /DNA_ID=CAMNT_0022355543 /DNA_START=27 /DNA_END=320 /DNA_ORIENTATION=-
MIAGGSADVTGKVRVGDELVAVEGKMIRGVMPRELARLMIGPPGSTVAMVFGRDQIDAPGTRLHIQVEMVRMDTGPGGGAGLASSTGTSIASVDTVS